MNKKTILKKRRQLRDKQRYLRNKTKIRKQQKKYYTLHKEEILKRAKKQYKKYYQKNKKEILIKNKEWKDANKERRKITNRIYKQKRRLEYRFRLEENIRRRINKAIKLGNKKTTVIKLLDCSIEKLKQHLESKFTKGMNWANYGKNGWEKNHIKPCCNFDLTKVEEQMKCFHYTNLQSLWAMDNRKKSNKIGKA